MSYHGFTTAAGLSIDTKLRRLWKIHNMLIILNNSDVFNRLTRLGTLVA